MEIGDDCCEDGKLLFDCLFHLEAVLGKKAVRVGLLSLQMEYVRNANDSYRCMLHSESML